MISITELLLIIITLLLLVLIYKVFRQSSIDSGDVEQAITNVWQQSGLAEQVSRLKVYAEDIRSDYRKLDQMLRSPQERAAIGEITLEAILSDQLPPDMFGIRKQIGNGKIPDAYIQTPEGFICIDSKFPLDNYRKMLDVEDSSDKNKFKKQFFKNVQDHLAKIAAHYVQPEQGTTPFALAFLPSEGVYYFLINEAYDLLQEYAKQGVQVVSPLTLSHKITILKTGLIAYRLNQQAERVHNEMLSLAARIRAIDEPLQTLSKHCRNAYQKVDELDRVYKQLQDEMVRIQGWW
ncbi:MAG: DNA recombination protein RmuC [Chloroflexus sp.]|uniref:DNA recombination protein RmuC n=1 Tax=Chloroflexus sp. TaxID=1904827 RepID=UPI00404A905A